LNENVLTEKGEELLLKQDEELTEIYQF
jgi:hypothetical protein